jgi:hypothetical protein
MNRLYMLLLAFFALAYTRSGAQTPESEPNNGTSQADFIPDGQTFEGSSNAPDFDWYQITMPDDGNLVIATNATSGLINTSLYTADSVLINFANLTSGLSSFQTNGVAAGTYYVRISGFSASFFSLYTVSFSYNGLSTVDEDPEPNDDLASALPAALNSTLTGTTGYIQASGARDNGDWYRLELPENANLRFTLTSAFSISIGVSLYDSTGVAIPRSGASFSTTSAVTQTVGGLSPGVYYLRINRAFTAQYGPYSLQNELLLPCADADPEGNTGPGTATVLPLGPTTEAQVGYLGLGGNDWFRLDLPQNGLLSVDFTGCESFILYAELYAADCTTLLTSTSGFNAFSLFKDGLAAGTYYLRCYTTNLFGFGQGYLAYTLTPQLSTYAYAADTQPNEWAADAPTLLSNSLTEAHLGFGGSAPYDARDWFKINYTGSDSLVLQVTTLANLNPAAFRQFVIRVYSDTAATPLFTGFYNHFSPDIVLTGLTPGYYYLKVEPQIISQFFAYHIVNSFREEQVASFNQFLSQAGTTCSNSRLRLRCTGSQPPYRVQLFNFGDPIGPEFSVADNNSVTINNLPAGQYTATVRGDGASAAAAGNSPSRDLVPAPTANTVSELTATSARLSWSGLPACIDGYQVRVTQGGTLVGQVIVSDAVTTRLIPGLNPGTTYDYTIRAGLNDNDSPATAISPITSGSFSTLALLADGEAQNRTAASAETLTLYPVPATDYLFLRGAAEDAVEIHIADLRGSLVSLAQGAQAVDWFRSGIPLSQLPIGSYTLSVRDAQGMEQHKIFSVLR